MDSVKDTMNNLNIMSSIEDDEYLKQLKAEYLSCPEAIKEIKRLGIPEEKIDESLIKIHDFVNDLKYCLNCPGMDKCQKTNPLLKVNLVYTHGFIERELTPCDKMLQKVEIQSRFKVHDFDNEWLDNDITKLDKTRGRAQALKKYLDYTKDLSDSWIFLTGEQNTGRSYFAASLALDLARRTKGDICYINAPLRFKELSDFSLKNKNKYQEVLDLYCNAVLLVIDDFGSEFKNDFTRDAILMQIITKRSAKKLLTIFTSDYTIDELETLYSPNKIAAIQANRIFKIIRNESQGEISLGELSLYR